MEFITKYVYLSRQVHTAPIKCMRKGTHVQLQVISSGTLQQRVADKESVTTEYGRWYVVSVRECLHNHRLGYERTARARPY